MIKNLVAILLSALVLPMACQPSQKTDQEEPATVSPATQASLTQESDEPINVKLDPSAFDDKLQVVGYEQLIDVRTPQEYSTGHLANSRMIDFKGKDFREKMARLDPDQPVMVYCAAGGRSTAAAALLEELGFPEIYELEGGINRWKEAGKVVEK